MSHFKVRITEKLIKEVYIDAESIEEALETAQARWSDSQYILDADDFSVVSFEPVNM